jgi:hypothetical protein
MREKKLGSRRRDKIYGKMENALFRHFEKKISGSERKSRFEKREHLKEGRSGAVK